MTIGLIAKKIGMTREFMDSGISIPVTVLSIEKGRILNVITKEKQNGGNLTSFVRLAETSLYIPPEDETDTPKETFFD